MTASRGATLRDLAWLLPLAGAVRALYLWQLAATPLVRHLVVDEAGYDRWARAIAAGQIVGDVPFYQAPLYPYALGAWYALMGTSGMGVRAAQAVGGVLSVVLLYLAGRRVFGRLAGCVAGATAALYAPFLFYEGMILKESWAILLMSLLLLLLLRAPGRSLGAWTAAGAVLGGLALLRENALAYLPVLLLWNLLRPPAGGEAPRPWRRRTAQCGALAGGMALALLPAIAHNLAAGGGLLLTTSQAGSNYYIGNHPGASGVYEPLRRGRSAPELEAPDAQREASRRAGRELARDEVSRFWFRESFRFARERPGEFLVLQLRKLMLTWHAREVPDAWDLEFVEGMVPLLRAPLVRFGWAAPLGLAGVALAWPFRRGAGMLALLLLATTLAVSAFFVFARYRLPLAPPVLLFAGHAVSRGRDLLRAGRFRSLGSGLALVAALALPVHMPLAWMGITFTDEVGHQNLGFLYQEAGDLKAAEEQFRAAVAINPDQGNAWLALGRVLEAGARPAEQEATLRRLLAHARERRRDGVVILDPAHEAEAHRILGERAREAGSAEEALAHYRAVAALLPDAASPLIHAGILLRHLGRPGEAEPAYAEALRRQPGDPLALLNRANLRVDAGDLAGAAALLREARSTCADRRPDLCPAIARRLEEIAP